MTSMIALRFMTPSTVSAWRMMVASRVGGSCIQRSTAFLVLPLSSEERLIVSSLRDVSTGGMVTEAIVIQ
ncbi:hypothetical protein ACFX11_019540 [Malus domestica]